jgi:hypothetical protein
MVQETEFGVIFEFGDSPCGLAAELRRAWVRSRRPGAGQPDFTSDSPGFPPELVGACSHVGSVEPDPSIAGIVQAVEAASNGEGEGQAESVQWSVNMNQPSTHWTKR